MTRTEPDWKRLVFASVLLAAVALALGFKPSQTGKQDQAATPDENTAVVQFARLDYTSPANKGFAVEAKDLARVQLVELGKSGLVLELFFLNGDYVLTHVDSLTFFKEVAGLQMRKVKVTRVPASKLSFPYVN